MRRSGAGEILIDQRALSAVEGMIHVDELPPLQLKGFAGTVPAYRVVGLQAGSPSLTPGG